MDLSTKSDEDLVSEGRAYLTEGEARIEASDHPNKARLAATARVAHALLQRVARSFSDHSGTVSTNATGGDKD